MARDRLAAMRAQQPNPTQASGDQSNPNNRGYQMAPLSSVSAGDMSAFYAEISSIQDTLRTFNDNVARIGDLHSRALNNMDDATAQRDAAQLDELGESTSNLSRDLKKRINALEAQRGSGRDGQIRQQQTALVKSKFVEAIQNYQSVEQQNRTKYKQRLERQLKIVKPGATPEEVKAVVDGDQGVQIFAQALTNSRHAGSRAAYHAAQERHEEIKRIEERLVELAELFEQMNILVVQQDDTINAIQGQADNVYKDTEAAVGLTDKAVVSARAARKKRWICFFIILIVLVVVAIVVAVEVVHNRNNNNT